MDKERVAWKRTSTSSRGGLGLPMDPQEEGPEAKKTKKTMGLTKVGVLLETCIDVESKNDEKPKKI